MEGLVRAWQWSGSDTILHPLPLHHIHGIVNALYCPAYVGATVNFSQGFRAPQVWQEIMVRSKGPFALPLSAKAWPVLMCLLLYRDPPLMTDEVPHLPILSSFIP